MERNNKIPTKTQPVTHGKVVSTTTTTTTTKTTTTVINGKTVTTTTKNTTTTTKGAPSSSTVTSQPNKQTTSKTNTAQTKDKIKEEHEIDTKSSLRIEKLSLEENHNSSSEVELTSLVTKWRGLFQNETITSHCSNIPESVMGSYKTLVAYLIKICNDDYEKFAVIYLWIVQNISYDVKNFFSGGKFDCSPEGVFKSRVGVCSGYSRLFTAMCEEVGLCSENVNGYAKGYGYVPGKKFKSTDHEWNVILINGTNYFVDACWGSGTVDHKQTFVRRFTPFYFMTPPEMFINDHLPADDKWQLLKTKVSLEEYEKRPKKDNETFVTAFYKNIFEPISHTEQEIISKSNELNVNIKVPGKTILANLKKDGNDVSGMTLVFCDSETNIYSINVMLPEKGTYELMVFAKDLTASPSDNYWSILTYRIICTSSTKLDKNASFPVVYNTLKNTLISPLNKYLKIGSEHSFKLKINDAEKVAVIQDGNWEYLQLSEDGIWQGKLKITAKKISVNSKRSDDRSFWGVVEYEGI